MSENQKSSEAMLGEALGHAINPALAKLTDAVTQQGEQFKSFFESQAETKSAKDAMESMKKEIEEKSQAEMKSFQENVEARFKEVKAKNPVYTGGVMQATDYATLSYQVKSDVVDAFISNNSKLTQEQAQKSLLLYKSFVTKYPELSSQCGIQKIVNEIEQKSFHNGVDASLGGLLANAPFMLDMVVQQSGESIIRQYANVVSSSSIQTEVPYMMKAGDAKTRAAGEDFDDGIAANFATKTVTAAEVYSPATLDINLELVASGKIGQILAQVENNLRYNVYAKLDNYYLGGGVVIQGSQGRIESIIPEATNQYEYQSNIPDAAYQMQLGKIAFIKSGVNGGVSFDSLNKLSLSLPRNGRRKVFMCHQVIYEKIKGLKDSNGNPYLINGNGINLFNQEITGINGALIVINDRLPLDVAIYGDIAGGYTISDAFGGYNMLDRPASNNSGVKRIIARVFSTAMITSYQAYRLYKLEV